VTRHLVRDVDVVEVWFGDKFLATIVPPPPEMGETAGVTIVSFYLDARKAFADLGKKPPAMFIPFDLEKKKPEMPNDQQT